MNENHLGFVPKYQHHRRLGKLYQNIPINFEIRWLYFLSFLEFY